MQFFAHKKSDLKQKQKTSSRVFLLTENSNIWNLLLKNKEFRE